MNEQTKRADAFAIQTMTKFIEFRWKWYSCAHISLSPSLPRSLACVYTHGLSTLAMSSCFCRLHFAGICTRSFSMRARANNEREPTMRQQQQHRAKNDYKRWRKKNYIILLCSTECVQVIVLMRHIVSLHSVVFIEIHSRTHIDFPFLLHTISNVLFLSVEQFTRYYFSFIISILFLFFNFSWRKKCVPYVCRVKRNNNNNK